MFARLARTIRHAEAIAFYERWGFGRVGVEIFDVGGDKQRDEILTPLGMMRSSFTQPMPPELAPDAAISYRCLTTSCVPITRDYRSAYPPGGHAFTQRRRGPAARAARPPGPAVCRRPIRSRT